MKTKNTINWHSPETMKVVKNAVKANPDNLRHAFSVVAKALKCDPNTVKASWYGTNGLKVRLSNLFTTKSDTKQFGNTKNVRRIQRNNLIHESVVSTKTVDNLKIETVRRVYAS